MKVSEESWVRSPVDSFIAGPRNSSDQEGCASASYSSEERPTDLRDSNEPQARSSRSAFNLDTNPQQRQGNIGDDVVDDHTTYDEEVKEPLGRAYPIPEYSSVYDNAEALYQRSTSYPAPNNALQLRVSTSSSTRSEPDYEQASNTRKQAAMEGRPVSTSSLSPSPSPSSSAFASKVNGSRASSLESSSAPRFHDRVQNGQDVQANEDAGDKPTKDKAGRPSLSGFRVRFRSRVRIASGIRHSKHECTVDCSPSSSISAPLRECVDNVDFDGPSWYQSTSTSPGASRTAPILPNGQIDTFVDDMFGFDGAVAASSASSSSNSKRLKSSSRPKRARRPSGAYLLPPNGSMPSPNERTPLVSSPPSQSQSPSHPHPTSYRHASRHRARHRAYLSDIADSDEDPVTHECEEGGEEHTRRHSLERAARKRDEELAFGRWPWRLVNGYWWWWKCEPVLCCCYASDSDSDDLE